ncbi:MAG: type I asparaginase, partial [Bacteroidales bacterium]|nr:type I asparaginase [Bacteroidales bacterium]
MTPVPEKASILLIYTGGTIGMKENAPGEPLRPFDFDQILSEVPELGKFAFKIDSYTFNPLIDSSDVEPGLWTALAELIQASRDKYDGFVVLHGTDTMAYSASALSFMLEGLDKSVIFTGSQLPISTLRTDGKENLVSAVEIASAKDDKGRARVPEVAVYFGSTLLRGNRSTKVDSESFTAFKSPNCPPLAQAGINIIYNDALIRRPTPDQPFRIRTRLDTSVSLLKVHPGITADLARYFLCGSATRASIIETYGSGNAISKPWFIDILKEANDMGKVLLNVTQCLSGSVNMDLYATGTALKEAGVISGYDYTTESALTKLFVLLGQYDDNAKVKTALNENLRGEITK